MAFKRVTMQDIADACGLSRNTVSKIFNDRGAVPEATREMVLQKARELGYLQGSEPLAAPPEPQARSIALLSCNLPKEYHFCNLFIPAFAERLSSYGYTLMVHKITPDELRQRALPKHLPLQQTAGILAIEVFDRDYMNMVCDLGLPTIFVDAWAGAFQDVLRCDVLMMENVAGTVAITNHVIAAGAKRLGFVGDITHCDSFLERWFGYTRAVEMAGLSVDKGACIIEDDVRPYEDSRWLSAQLQRMPKLPDAFICANDLVAIRLMTAIKQLGLSIPRDIMVTGFDNQPQSAVVEPALTTVHIPSDEIGTMAADLLCNRIKNPRFPPFSARVKTTPIFRASTQR